MERRALILVKGRVQGVYFRASAARMAAGLGIRGYVENLPGGDVRIVAEGSADSLRKLVEWCGEGPEHAQVRSLECRWLPPEGGFADFRIKGTKGGSG